MVGAVWLARVLRGGAVASGALFVASMVAEGLGALAAAGLLRKVAAAVLVATPIVRLVAAGVMLGLKGERRYALYAAGVLVLLALSVVAGLSSF
jgi:uncharacterized membrane protein